VQKIAVLDIRVLNCDRHGGNILVSKEDDPPELVPIDHGYCLGSTLNEAFFEWLNWPQVSVPTLPEVREYILSLSIEKDVEILRNLNVPASSIRTFIASSLALQLGSRCGLTLYQIGSLVSPAEATRTSPLESMLSTINSTINFELTPTESNFLASAETFIRDWAGSCRPINVE